MTPDQRLLAAWRRYWFTPSPLADLGVARILVALVFLWLYGTTRFLRVAFVAPAFWQPQPIVAFLAQPDYATLQWLAHLTAVLLVAVLFGVGTRAALAALVPLVLVLVQEAWLNSAGKITHGTVPLVWALVFLALAPCDRAFALGALVRRARAAAADPAALAPPPALSPYARWPLELLFVELAAFYGLAGVAKLRASGLAWADGWTLQYHLLTLGTPAGQWVAGHVWLCAALSTFTLAFELGAALGLVRRARPLVLAAGAAFHLGTTLLMRITFWPVVALYPVFVPWTRVGRWVARRTGLDGPPIMVPFDGGCGRCRAAVSLARDLDPTGRVRPADVAAGHGPAGPAWARALRRVPLGGPHVPGCRLH